MTRIVLHGALGERFGAEWNLEVKNVREAMQAIEANTDGFLKALLDNREYAVFIDDKDVDIDRFEDPLGGRTIRIVPMIAGFRNFLIDIIIIIVAIVIAVVSYGSGTGASASLLTTYFGSTAVAAAVSAAVSAFAVALLINGITDLLSPQKKKNDSKTDSPANTPSYTFNGPVNTTAQGNPFPVGYGRLLVGSAILSAGLYNEQVDQGNSQANPDPTNGNSDPTIADPNSPDTSDGLYVGTPLYGAGIGVIDNHRDLGDPLGDTIKTNLDYGVGN